MKVNVKFITDLLEIIADPESIIYSRWNVAIFQVRKVISIQIEFVASLSNQPRNLSLHVILF